MKLLKLLSCSLVLIGICSTASKAQSNLKLTPYCDSKIDSVQIKPLGPGKLMPFSYKRIDSVQTTLLDSMKFNKKPNYNALNSPVPMPNSFKPQQNSAAAMPILKIMLKKED